MADIFESITVPAGTSLDDKQQKVETPKPSDAATDPQPPAKETQTDTQTDTPPVKPSETDTTPPKAAQSDKDQDKNKDANIPKGDYDKLKTDYEALNKRCVALEREVGFFQEQQKEIETDPKAWAQKFIPSAFEAPIDIDKELEKEFGENFVENEYQPGAKAGTKSFLYDMRRTELWNKINQNKGQEIRAAVDSAKKIRNEGFEALDNVVTDLKTRFNVDDAYLAEKIKQAADYAQSNPYKMAAYAIKSVIESENMTLERAKEIVAKDELLKKEKNKVTPTPPSGKGVSMQGDQGNQSAKDESGFADLVQTYKKSGFH